MQVNPGMYIRLIFLSIGLLSHSTHLQGQSDFSYAIGGGAMYYNGDLSDDSYIPPVEIIKPFVSADISILLVDRLDLSVRYMHGSVKGDDALSKDLSSPSSR